MVGGEGMDVRLPLKSDSNLPSGYVASPVVSSPDHPDLDHVMVEPLKYGVNLLHGYLQKTTKLRHLSLHILINM